MTEGQQIATLKRAWIENLLCNSYCSESWKNVNVGMFQSVSKETSHADARKLFLTVIGLLSLVCAFVVCPCLPIFSVIDQNTFNFPKIFQMFMVFMC